MPIDYRNYHPMWKRISRFVRVIRARNCCEQCGLENYTVRLYADKEVVETLTGFTDYQTARAMATRLFVEADSSWPGNAMYRSTVVILTVAHLDHDVGNNDLDNLQALCQGCHLGHDRRDNANRRRYGPKGRHHNQIRIEL